VINGSEIEFHREQYASLVKM